MHHKLEHTRPVHDIGENPVEGNFRGIAAGFAAGNFRCRTMGLIRGNRKQFALEELRVTQHRSSLNFSHVTCITSLTGRTSLIGGAEQAKRSLNNERLHPKRCSNHTVRFLSMLAGQSPCNPSHPLRWCSCNPPWYR